MQSRSSKTATEPTPGAGWRTGVVIFEPGWIIKIGLSALEGDQSTFRFKTDGGHTHPSQENSYGGKKQRVERK
jgi:hypothetical protein